jgi:phage-related minor tail protein
VEKEPLYPYSPDRVSVDNARHVAFLAKVVTALATAREEIIRHNREMLPLFATVSDKSRSYVEDTFGRIDSLIRDRVADMHRQMDNTQLLRHIAKLEEEAKAKETAE